MVLKEAWITSAEDDVDALRAIRLAKSLRRTHTARKIFVVFGLTVSDKIKESLMKEFDGIVPLDVRGIQEDEKGLPGFEEAVKVTLHGSRLFKRGIFVSSSILVLDNVDFFFDVIFNGEAPSWEVGGKGKSMKIQLNSPLFAVKPSTQNFQFLKQILANNSTVSLPGFENEQRKTKGLFSSCGLCLRGSNSEGGKDLKLREGIVRLVRLGEEGDEVISGLLPKIWGDLGEVISELLEELSTETAELELPEEAEGEERVPLERMEEEPIAIVGMACRFPGANDVEEFWRLLVENGDAITTVPEWRWPEEQVNDVTAEDRKSKAGFLKCPVDEFDGKFFGMSPKELEFTDPQQRLLLEVSWEALEDAAVDATSLKGTQTGIFTGTWTHHYEDMMNKTGFAENEFFRSYMGNAYGATAGRMAHFYGTTGSNIATESGCSSSMVAVGLACKSLRRKETSMALACGVNLLVAPFEYKEMEAFCAEDGHCKTFDAAADGFGRAEGVGVLVLKRLADAVAAGDVVRAVIRGYGEAQEGPSKSLGTPTVDVEALAMQLALEEAQVLPSEVSFVEAHGTGTPVGDPMEMNAIAKVYSRGRKVPLLLTSVKTNIGHTESCSGIAGMIKTVLSLEREVIAPHRALTNLNPKIDLSKTPASIPLVPTPWPRAPLQPRIAGVSSFGITGTDTHVILQEAPKVTRRQIASIALPFLPLAISARSEAAATQLLQNYADYLRLNSTRWEDVTCTANTGRTHFGEYRAAVVASDVPDFLRQIERQSVKVLKCRPTSERQKVVFLFTGQGSQYAGMARELFDVSSDFQGLFNKCDVILRERFGVDIKRALWESTEDANLLQQTLYSQTAIFVVDFCLAELWKSWGVYPDVVVGHSLGEYAAAAVAGILSFDDALTLVAQRSRLIDALPRGKMIVVNADVDVVQDLIKKSGVSLEIAAMNSPDQTTLAGKEDSILALNKFCDNNGMKSHVLDASHAFHSEMMDTALPALRKAAQNVNYKRPTCTFISGTEGREVTSLDAEYWVRHTRLPVNFIKASDALRGDDGIICIEVGPQPILSTFVSRNFEANASELTLLPSLRRKQSDWRTLMDSLARLYTAGVDVDWAAVLRQAGASKLAGLPTYPFQRRKFWFEKPKNDGLLFSGNQLHPLVNFRFPSAAVTKTFQTRLSLRKETYVNDHVVGRHVIFPGAGYVEMILAAGHSATLAEFEEFRHPRQPLFLRDLIVDAPMALTQNEDVNLQTIVAPAELSASSSADESNWSGVSVHRQQEDISGTKSWVRHSSAKFSSFSNDTASFLESPETIDVDQMKSSSDVETIDDFYESLREVGIIFGVTFRSIRRVWKGATETLAEIAALPSSAYLAHPVVIDAMLQVILYAMYGTVPELLLPVKIDKVAWFGNSGDLSKLFVHVNNDATVATLFDESGRKLAAIGGVAIVPTSIQGVENALEAQKLVLPTILEELWVPGIVSPGGDSLVENNFFQSTSYGNFCDWERSLPPQSDEQKVELQLINELCALQTLQTFLELGWFPKTGEKITIPKFVEEFKISSRLTLSTRRMFEILAQHTKFVEGSDMRFRIVEKLPTAEEVAERIFEIDQSIRIMRTEFDCVRSVAEKSAGVLRGEDSVLPVLFGEGNVAEKIYTDFQSTIQSNRLLEETITRVAEGVASRKGKLRILEVGGGTGGSTRSILPALTKAGVDFSYTFTDISAGFFLKAEEAFSEWRESMAFKVFDVEKDPKTQGFVHEEFDVVVATHVLHATRNMRETMANVRNLLRPNGLALIIELYEPTEAVDLIFGLVDGYWLFQDFDLRPYHCIVPETSWPQLLSSTGFPTHQLLKVNSTNCGLIVAQASSTSVEYSLPSLQATWIVVRGSPDDHFALEVASQLERQGRRVFLLDDVTVVLGKLESTNKNGNVEGVVFVSEGISFDAEESTKNFLLLLQTLISPKMSTISTPPKLVVVTKGAAVVGDQSHGFPHSSPLWGMSRTYRSEFPNLSCVNVDVDPHDTPEKNAVSLLRALWTEKDEMLAVRNGNFFALRIKKVKLRNNALQLPSNSSRFELAFPATNAIADLRFRVSPCREVEGSNVEIELKAAALNFRDIFSVLKPSKEFEKNAAVGTDMAGVVSAVGPDVTNLKVGDAVIGAFFGFGGLPSHVVVPEESVVRLPQNFTLADGSTLPAVFATAYLCLVDVAELKKGETVLIHTASGGVGIAAIQVAREVGARIIATAGSRRKRAFLKEVMGVEEVFHSRDVSYAAEILRVTEGRGVDVVLNSLTGPGFKEATLDATAKNGRFIEMSKLNVWSVDEVKNLRPDVAYQIVDLTSESKETWKHLLFHLKDFMSKGKLRPLPYEVFEAVEIRAALTHLQKARHVGKIVVRMPSTADGSDVGGGRRQLLFNARSSYLITGGLGGIGLEAAKWMASEGAKFLVLCGRRPPNDNAARVIADLNAIGKVVVAVQADVGNWEDCRLLVESINSGELRVAGTSFPPLRGIQHAAGCLSDGMLLNQTWPKFQVTFNAKVNGAWHLHKLTQHAAFPLEHFVMYSSVAATFGALGLSNHAAANTFLDALTHFRNARGLPATSVNWGQWGQIGVAADLDLSFATPFTPLQGFSSLKEILRSHKAQVGVLEVDLPKIRLAYLWVERRYGKDIFGSLSSAKAEKQFAVSLTSEAFWKEIDAAQGNPKETEDVIRKIVVQIVSVILKMDDNDTIDVQQNFQEMGLDSLMMVELKNVLQGILGAKVALTANLLADANSVASLATKLRQLILDDGSDVKSPEEMKEFILTQATLSDTTKPETNEKLADLGGELTFLVTGKVESQFGACVVENLTQRQNVKKVVILTSADKKPAVLEQLNHSEELNVIHSKVEIVLIIGEASYLTATLPDYDKLASEVDVVVDCRLTSSNEETASQIRKEAEETENLLRFACEKKLKFVCHVNRLLPQRRATEERVLEEMLPECSSDVLKEYGDYGYPSTQFVSECLLKSAVERGVPCRVFRLPHVSGDSRSGRFQLEEGHIFLRYFHFMRVGKIPTIPVPFAVVPVNQAASLILDALMDKPNVDKTAVAFNVNNPHEYSYSDFFEVSAELGKPVRAVELEEFMSEEGSVLKSIKYNFGDPLDFSIENSAYSKLSKTSALIPFANLRSVVGDLEAQVETPLQILRRDLTFAQNSGFFEKFVMAENPPA